jgi:putative FmdB family regulatory protein
LTNATPLLEYLLMPIYEYECAKCGVFEAIQKPNDKPLKAQPECPHKDCPKNAHKVISQSAFHLKGGGWYKTDYASPGSASGGTKKTAESKTEETKTSEAKPAESKSESTTPAAASKSDKA